MCSWWYPNTVMYFLFFVILLRDEDVCNFPNVLKNRQYQPYLQVFFAFFIETHLDKFVFLSLFWELWCLLDQELNKVPELYRTFQNARAFSESFERALLLDRCIFFFLWMADGLGLSQKCPTLLDSDNHSQLSHNHVYSWILDNFAETSHILFTVFLSHKNTSMIHWVFCQTYICCAPLTCVLKLCCFLNTG